MSESRYSELKYNGQTYTEQWKIDEILIKNKFNWLVNAEIKNARLEIFENTLVWNAGIWYNGSWYFGVWRDGEWRYGTWQNGVWYNGVWRDGTFKSGIIYKGKFFKGKIESGEIRGGQFISIEIDPKVVEYTEDEYQVKKQEEQKEIQQAAVATTQSTIDQAVKVHSTPPENHKVPTQPKIQQEKKEYKNMKKIKTFEAFFNAFENLQKDNIYTLIDFLDKKHSELDSDEFGGNYLNYNIIDNDTLEVNLGWDSPEEFMRLESIIKFEDDKITLKGSQEGFSVYSEDGKNYENNYNESFDTVEDLISFLDKEI